MSEFKLYTLGTGAQAITKERSHSCYFLKLKNEGLLFDPGEGAQRQMLFGGDRIYDPVKKELKDGTPGLVSFAKITRIFISHFHGDHCLGLPGVLMNINLLKINHEVHLYYPASGKENLEAFLKSSIYELNYKLIFHELEEPGEIMETLDYSVEAFPLNHDVECWGFRVVEKDSVSLNPSGLPTEFPREKISELKDNLIEKHGENNQVEFIEFEGFNLSLEKICKPKPGRIFAYILDTGPCKNFYKLADEADIVLCDSTYLESDMDDTTKYVYHLSAKKAAKMTTRSKGKLLLLTHFSRRYTLKDSIRFIKETAGVHDHVIAATDGLKIELKKKLG